MDKYERAVAFIEQGDMAEIRATVDSLDKLLKDYRQQVNTARKFGLGHNLLALTLMTNFKASIDVLQSKVDRVVSLNQEILDADE